ncbi:basal cell adhesion molecule-like isoform X2 [Tribolium madens]|uniref:basal cell adhesion molecule-like isoform X2 n=1 Tax=Tribolium madens TaxID=41895 RepID=UPI001CF7387C|nr:basal cell adhesion molecule-like isoform X2 [Tribolium madens]
MKTLDFGIGFFLAALLTGTRGLRDVRINVPSAVVRGDDATLQCYYDLEGEQLYAVKWYLGTTEFYRYTPKEIPPIKQFSSQSGLTVREVDSNATSVVLEHVPRSISGRYSCEVSADAPSFYTAIQSAYLQVVDLPPRDPYISINKTRYHNGEMLKATCTSEHSNPAVNLTWYVNGLPAESKYVHNNREKSADGQYHTSHSVLRMKITKQSFVKHRLKIRCVARMYDIYYKSHEKSVESERKRHHHYFVTTTEPPVQWELVETLGANPEVRFVFNSSVGTYFSKPVVSIVHFVMILILFR